MLEAYNESIRAEEAILLAKGKMAVGHKPVPRHVMSKHIAKTLKRHKKAINKLLKHIKTKLVKKVEKHAKELAKHFAKKGQLKKDRKEIRDKAKHEVKKLLAKHMHNLKNKVGKNAAHHIAEKITKAAARHVVIAVHSVVDHHKHGVKALAKLRTVGRKVAEQITKEALANHKPRRIAAHQGAQAGKAAVKFAS